jgi:hypothetical protein
MSEAKYRRNCPSCNEVVSVESLFQSTAVCSSCGRTAEIERLMRPDGVIFMWLVRLPEDGGGVAPGIPYLRPAL